MKARGVFGLIAAFLISFLVCLMMTGLLSAIKENNPLNHIVTRSVTAFVFYLKIFTCDLCEIMHVDY